MPQAASSVVVRRRARFPMLAYSASWHTAGMSLSQACFAQLLVVRSSLWIFEEKRDCSQSNNELN